MTATSTRTTRPGTLKSPKEFQKVFRSGVKHRYGSFNFYSVHSGLPVARLGLSVAKKEVSKAVKRNRLKRLIRESFRVRYTTLIGLDVVVVARGPAAELSNAVVILQLDRGWAQMAQTAALPNHACDSQRRRDG